MTSRLERALIQLARQYASHLIPANWEQRPASEWAETLARQLASYNLLVLIGYTPKLPPEEQTGHIQNWINEYARFYHLLADNLFPSLTGLSAQYADNEFPPIVILQGHATAVIHVMAGYVSPYLALRQSFPYVSEVEQMGLMDVILGELEAQDLPRESYDKLKSEGMKILTRLLSVPIHQVRVTPFDKPIFGTIKRPPLQTSTPPPKSGTPPPKPGTVPETGSLNVPPEVLKPKPEPPALPDPPPQPKTPQSGDAPVNRLPSLPIPGRTKSRLKRRLPVPDRPGESSDDEA